MDLRANLLEIMKNVNTLEKDLEKSLEIGSLFQLKPEIKKSSLFLAAKRPKPLNEILFVEEFNQILDADSKSEEKTLKSMNSSIMNFNSDYYEGLENTYSQNRYVYDKFKKEKEKYKSFDFEKLKEIKESSKL